jgi:hypothetical protein
MPIGTAPRWRNVAEDIDGLNPVRLIALDGEDRTLRVERFGAQDAAPRESTPEVAPVASPALTRLPFVPQDAETQRFIIFATLLAETTERSSGRAIDALTSIVRSQDERFNALKKDFDALKLSNAQELAEATARLDDLVEIVENRVEEPPEQEGTVQEQILSGLAQGFVSSKLNGGAS